LTDFVTLFVGALVGFVSSAVLYLANYFLNIREQKILRDFGVREKGRDFFHQIYGTVATLSDLVVPFKGEENDNEGIILTEEGYIALPKEEVIRRYKTAYAKYAKLWYESREKGLEIFLLKDFVANLLNFWAYASYFNEDEESWNNKKAICIFEKIRNTNCNEMDKLMGLTEPYHIIPKWLNPKTWSRTIRGEKN
jgi:hypothetical protein